MWQEKKTTKVHRALCILQFCTGTGFDTGLKNPGNLSFHGSKKKKFPAHTAVKIHFVDNVYWNSGGETANYWFFWLAAVEEFPQKINIRAHVHHLICEVSHLFLMVENGLFIYLIHLYPVGFLVFSPYQNPKWFTSFSILCSQQPCEVG